MKLIRVILLVIAYLWLGFNILALFVVPFTIPPGESGPYLVGMILGRLLMLAPVLLLFYLARRIRLRLRSKNAADLLDSLPG